MVDRDASNATPPPPLPAIRASELAQYSFCHRAWWLGTIEGVSSSRPARLARGQQTHDRHARNVRTALFWRQAGFFLLGSGMLFLLIAVLWLWIFS